MEKKIYVVEGTPIAWARAVPGYYKVWDAQKQLKMSYSMQLEEQHGNLPFYSGPIHLDATFYFKVPKSRGKQYSSLLLSPHFFKPDLSNLIKLIEDVAVGILFRDDCTIASITARKVYDDRSRTEFSVTEIKKGGMQ